MIARAQVLEEARVAAALERERERELWAGRGITSAGAGLAGAVGLFGIHNVADQPQSVGGVIQQEAASSSNAKNPVGGPVNQAASSSGQRGETNANQEAEGPSPKRGSPRARLRGAGGVVSPSPKRGRSREGSRDPSPKRGRSVSGGVSRRSSANPSRRVSFQVGGLEDQE